MKTLIAILVLILSSSLFAEDHIFYLDCSLEKFYNLTTNNVVDWKEDIILTIDYYDETKSDGFVKILSEGLARCDEYFGNHTETNIYVYSQCEDVSKYLEINRMNGKFYVYYYEDEDHKLEGKRIAMHAGSCKKSEKLF